jgi:hypothetical protein
MNRRSRVFAPLQFVGESDLSDSDCSQVRHSKKKPKHHHIYDVLRREEESDSSDSIMHSVDLVDPHDAVSSGSDEEKEALPKVTRITTIERQHDAKTAWSKRDYTDQKVRVRKDANSRQYRCCKAHCIDKFTVAMRSELV